MTREEAIQVLESMKSEESYNALIDLCNMAIEALSADAVPTVIRAKTFMRKEDFDKWAEDIKKQNKSIVCIPCDAEVVLADAVKAVQDCRNCKYGSYNDHFDTWFCYHSCECNDWNLWESADVEQTEYKLPGHDEVMEAFDKLTLRGDMDE